MAISILKRYKLPVNDCAMQESYLGMCEAAARFDPGRGCKFTTYAFNYIRHRIAGHYAGYSNAFPKRGIRLRRYLEGKTIDVDFLRNDIGYSCNGIEKKVITKDLISKALRALTSDQRQTVIDRHFNDMTCREMAEQRGFTRRTHTSRLSKALAKMRAALST
jgi:RNA polymerase sigma factor (sigma-70 family)